MSQEQMTRTLKYGLMMLLRSPECMSQPVQHLGVITNSKSTWNQNDLYLLNKCFRYFINVSWFISIHYLKNIFCFHNHSSKSNNCLCIFLQIFQLIHIIHQIIDINALQMPFHADFKVGKSCHILPFKSWKMLF